MKYRFKLVLSFLIMVLVLPLPALAFSPSDTQLYNQEYLDRINAFEAWDLIQDENYDREVVVAVLDAGVDLDHPDLQNVIWVNSDEIPNNGIDDDGNSYIDDYHGWDFVESNGDPRPKFKSGFVEDAIHHGTVVAGIIGAEFDNGKGIAGLVPNAKIMPLRILDSNGVGNTLTLSQAIDYAVENGADVVNMSLVGASNDSRLEKSILNAYNNGVAVIAAAGNEEIKGLNLNVNPRYPVCDTSGQNYVYGVAALNRSNQLPDFSNYGSLCIDISAPGTEIYSSLTYEPTQAGFDEFYGGNWQGTSVAAPMVSGTVANIKKVAPNLSLNQIYNIVSQNADSLANTNPNNFTDLGAGALNMEASLRAALSLSNEFSNLYVYSTLGGKPLVMVIDEEGNIISSFFAYNPNFTGGVVVATADTDGDGELEIITAPHSSGGPHVRIFDMAGNLEGQFMAYDPNYRGGLNITTADFDGDGRAEIVTAPKVAAGPHVKVFNSYGEETSSFFAYAEKFRGGVYVKAIDTDRDGQIEIVTSPYSGGGPHIRVFDQFGGLESQFMAFDPSTRGGYPLAAADIDNDKNTELVILDNNNGNKAIATYKPFGSEENTWTLFAPSEGRYSAGVLTGDFTGDLLPEIVFYPTEKSSATLKVYNYEAKRVKEIVLPVLNNYGLSIALLPG